MKQPFQVLCRLLACLILSCLLLLPACAQEAAETLSVTFFDAGKADAILVRAGEQAMLIDTGLDKNGEELTRRLEELGVTRLDALIITHFDKDHVGGADVLLAEIPVSAVYQPDYFKDSKQMNQYRRALSAAGLTPITLSEDCAFSLGGAQVSIDTANEADYGPDEENDFSLIVRLQFGDVHFLFAGDAEEARIAELLQEGDLACDVLKVPHHGKKHDNNAEFFQAAGASYAVITCSNEEPEKQETVRLLEEAGSTVLLTRLGEITVTSDGQCVTALQ